MKNYTTKRFRSIDSFRRDYKSRQRNRVDKLCEQLYRDWYGQERAVAEIESLQPPEREIKTILSELLISLDKEDHILLREIIDKWKDEVSPEIGYHASPRQIKNKTLFIEVYDNSWRFYLELNLKQEIQKIVQRISTNRINTIRFITGGKTKRKIVDCQK